MLQESLLQTFIILHHIVVLDCSKHVISLAMLPNGHILVVFRMLPMALLKNLLEIFTSIQIKQAIRYDCNCQEIKMIVQTNNTEIDRDNFNID